MLEKGMLTFKGVNKIAMSFKMLNDISDFRLTDFRFMGTMKIYF